MVSALDYLAELGIRLRNPDRPGEHRAPCPWCDKGPRDDALAVRLEPDGGATWFCHRCGERDGIRGERTTRSVRLAPRQERQPEPEPERYETLAPWGLTRWGECQLIMPGTVAARYLEQRGCALPPTNGDLRWHPAVKHRSGHVGPALVGLVTDILTGEAISLHRTWIKPDGSGKAEIEGPRRLMHKHRGDGVIRLWPNDEVTLGLVLGEGLETCLAAARAGRAPCWATINAKNLGAFLVLPGIEALTILVDHDRPNPKTGKRAGHEAARAVIDRYAAAGFDRRRDLVVIHSPIQGEDAADLEIGP